MSEQQARRLDGRIAVVTGASAGVGAAAATRLTALGATVAVVGRSPEKTAAVARRAGAEPYTVDFARLDDVRRLADVLAKRYPTIDILANNAGGQMSRRVTTADGHEMTMQVNYLAPFLLTTLLLNNLATSRDARVISTSSQAHAFGRLDVEDLDGMRRRYNPMRFYAASKLANILFTRELARRSEGSTVTAAAFHPGAVDSDFFRDGGVLATIMRSPLGKRFTITPEEGAAPVVHLVTAPDARSINGAYFNRFDRAEPRGRQASDQNLAHRLWDSTNELLGVGTDRS